MNKKDFQINNSQFLKLLLKSWWKHKILMFICIFFTLITVCCYVVNIKIIQWMTSIMMSKDVIDIMYKFKDTSNTSEISDILTRLGFDSQEITKFIEALNKMSESQKATSMESVIHYFFFDYVNYQKDKVYITFLYINMDLFDWCYFMFANIVIIMLSTYLAYIFSGIIASIEEKNLKNSIIIKLMDQDVSYFNNSKIGDLISVVVNDTDKIGKQLKSAPIIFIQALFTTIGALAVMTSVDWLLCLITLSLLFVVVVVVFIILRLTKRTTNNIDATKQDINSEIAEKLYSMKLVKSSGTWEDEKARYTVLNNEIYKYEKQINLIKEIITALLIGAIGSFVMSSIIFGVFLYNNQVQILLGKMTAFTTGVLIMTLPFMQLNDIAVDINNVENCVNNYNLVMDEDIFINKSGGKKIIGIINEIDFDNVYFSFPDNPGKIYIRNLSLHFERGKKYALVGESGCGKSTIIKLILRYFDTIRGSIGINYVGRLSDVEQFNWVEELEINDSKFKKKKEKHSNKHVQFKEIQSHTKNKNNIILENNNNNNKNITLKQLDLQSWLERVGYVSQEPQILSGTIYENIRYTKNDLTDFEIVEACKKAKIHDYIMTMPNKYNTILTEQGSSLSGGQKQRLVIARMFAKNPDILILDEATSALDGVIEAEIQEELDKLMVGRTTISIAHKLNTIKDFDKIIVLEPLKGVVQDGTFNELISKPGIFQELYKHQNDE